MVKRCVPLVLVALFATVMLSGCAELVIGAAGGIYADHWHQQQIDKHKHK